MYQRTISLIAVLGFLSGCVTAGVRTGDNNGSQPVSGNTESGGTKELKHCGIPPAQRLTANLDLGGDADTQTKALIQIGVPSNPLPAMRLIAQQSGCFVPSAYTKAMERAGRDTNAKYTLLVEVITSNQNESGAGGMAGIGSLFGPVGLVVGAVAGSVRKSGAGVVLTLVNNRDGEQIASASGSATGTSFGFGGALGVVGSGAAGIGGFGGYENTDQGKVIIGAMIDAMNNLITMIPQLQLKMQPAAVQHSDTNAKLVPPPPPPPTKANANLVEEIQAALKVNGYSVTADGQYGPKTKTAIADWQSKNGLPADGSPTQSLLDAMNSKINSKEADVVAEPTTKEKSAPQNEGATENAPLAPRPTKAPEKPASTKANSVLDL